MNYTTKNKIDQVRQYIRRNYKGWINKYPDIVGVHIGKKTVDDQVKREFSIVFHVVKKKNKRKTEAEIPGYFTIRIKGRPVNIPTDVIESGRPGLSDINPGDKIFHQKFPAGFGSASLFLTDKKNIFLLSNMHVIGKLHLKKTFTLFDAPHDFGKAEVFCRAGNDDTIDIACFKSGAVDDFLDAAIAIINPLFHDIVENRFNGKPIENFAGVDLSVATNPQPVIIRGAASGLIKNIAINSNTAVRTFKYPLGSMTLFDLLQISPCHTKGGDSGSPIIDAGNNKILGIVIGKDSKNTFTYGIPIDRILDFFQLTILKKGS